MLLSSYKKGLVIVAVLLLLGYMYFLFSQTVFYRSSIFPYNHFLMPFWSYRAILDGRHELIIENLLNVVIFIPIGFLLGFIFKSIRWWKVSIVGLFVSVTIEFLQYALNRGSAEVDDVIHNLLGSMIGFGLFVAIKILFRRVKELKGKNNGYEITRKREIISINKR